MRTPCLLVVAALLLALGSGMAVRAQDEGPAAGEQDWGLPDETPSAGEATAEGEPAESAAEELPLVEEGETESASDVSGDGGALTDGTADDAAAAAAAGIFGMVAFMWVVMLLLYGLMFLAMLALMALWIWMLVDVIKRDFPQPNEKTMWVLVVILANWIGAIIYYFMIKRKSDLAAKAGVLPPES